MSNINDSFFDGYYKEIWKAIIPDELTRREVDFMIPYFDLHPGSKVLDLMCGYGRHAIALARKNIPVIAIDNLPEYIKEIKELSGKEKLPVKAILGSVIDYKIDGQYDLALCMGNSLNFFNADDTRKILNNIFLHLKYGGHLLINSWSIAEIAIRNFKEKGESNIGNMKMVTDSQYLFHPTRIETKSTIVMPDGTTENKEGVDYIFSLAEIETMLDDAGLSLKEIYSIPGKKKFTLGEPRAYIVAEKSPKMLQAHA